MIETNTQEKAFVCMHAHLRVNVYMHVYVCMHVFVCSCVCIHFVVCVHLCMYMHMHTCVPAHAQVYTGVSVLGVGTPNPASSNHSDTNLHFKIIFFLFQKGI